jgi:hypothetical protein
MTKPKTEIKPQLFTVKDIKHVLLERGDTMAGLVRQWNESHPGLNATQWQLKAVIYRYPRVVYQRLRELLAEYLGCEVWQVGREAGSKIDVPGQATEAEVVGAAS